jgi:phosphoglucan,water dikinase
VAIEDPNLAAKARALADAPGVHLKAAPSAISLDACEGGYVGGGGGGGGTLSSRVAAALVADTSAAGQVIDLRDLGAAEWSRAVAVAGSKATACASLSALAAESGAFAAPAGAVLPFGSFELAATQAGADGRLAFLLDALESVAGDATQTAQICDELQSLARATRPSRAALEQLSVLFPRGSRVMVRSTGNAEDLAGLSAAGLYDSVSNVDPHDFETLGGAVAEVWASLFTTRAVGSRAAAGVGQRDAAMAVLAQQMLVPEVSFILMTKHPMTGDANVAYAELALGHGETLASGAVRGTPWRLSMNRLVPGEARLDAVSSFGAALVPSASGNGELVSEPVNCGAHWMTVDEHRRATLSARLVTAGDLIERRLLGADGRAVPQDIEGCVTADGEVWIVQARPQP